MTPSVTKLATPSFSGTRRSWRHSRGLFTSRSMPDLLAWPFAVLVSIFVLQYSIYVIHAVALDRVLKLGSLFFLCTLFPYRRMTRKFGWTLALFAALFASAGVASLVMLDSTGI